MLTDITLYWVTGAIGSSFWPYYARMHGPWPIPEGARRRCADGLRRVPQGDPAAAALGGGRRYTNIQRWTMMQKGGHFAALEQPEALAREIRAFFRPLR